MKKKRLILVEIAEWHIDLAEKNYADKLYETSKDELRSAKRFLSRASEIYDEDHDHYSSVQKRYDDLLERMEIGKV